MPTQEERLINLEKTVALLREQSSGINLRGLNRDVTTVFGMASRQELDIQDVKTSLARLETGMNEQFEGVGQTLATILEMQDKRFGALEQSVNARFKTLEQNVNARFDVQDKKLDQMLLLLTTLTSKPDKEA